MLARHAPPAGRCARESGRRYRPPRRTAGRALFAGQPARLCRGEPGRHVQRARMRADAGGQHLLMASTSSAYGATPRCPCRRNGPRTADALCRDQAGERGDGAFLRICGSCRRHVPVLTVYGPGGGRTWRCSSRQAALEGERSTSTTTARWRGLHLCDRLVRGIRLLSPPPLTGRRVLPGDSLSPSRRGGREHRQLDPHPADGLRAEIERALDRRAGTYRHAAGRCAGNLGRLQPPALPGSPGPACAGVMA